jgi:mannose-1-phosphate guanylyltransferase
MVASMSRALVLAAGVGSRIRAIAGDLPKPLIPFGGRSILAHNLSWLAAGGVREVWINLHFQADMIRQEIGDGSAFGLAVHYVYEPELLGTAGALANIADAVEPGMLLVYGDNLLRFDLNALRARHQAARAELTMTLFDQDRHRHTGIAGGRVVVDEEGAVSGFVEGASAGSSLVNAGVYALEPSVLDLIPRDGLVDFGKDVFPAMLAKGRRLVAHVMEPDGVCLGLDTPESFAAGEALLASGEVRL